MAGPKLGDLVADTTTTTGTGAATLSGSAPDRRFTFGSVLSNGDTCLYVIEHRTADEVEYGLGTYSTTGPALTRTTVYGGSNGTSAVDLSSGTKDVRIAPLTSVWDKVFSPTDTYANLAAFRAGRLLFPSNGFALPRDNGTDKYDVWGPCLPLKDPQAQTWAWVNQGTATVSSTNGGVHLYEGTAEASAYQWRIRKKSAPATPYTADFCLLPRFYYTHFSLVAALWRQSSDGKLVTVTVSNFGGDTSIEVNKFNSETSYSADYFTMQSADFFAAGAPAVFLRLADDGTSRKISVGRDGQNWSEIHSVGRTDFMTADEVGFGAAAYSRVTGLTVLGYREG